MYGQRSDLGPSCPGSEDEAAGTSASSSGVSRTPSNVSNSSSVSWTPQASTTTTLPNRRKVQKVQLLHLPEPSRYLAKKNNLHSHIHFYPMATQFRELVNPSEVQISSGHEVFLAQPVVTPIERLRRKDKEVARALDRVHQSPGIDGQALELIHRDLKPDNLQITPAGDVKILDFGIARASFARRESRTTENIAGTVGYIAPERMDGEEFAAGDKEFRYLEKKLKKNLQALKELHKRIEEDPLTLATGSCDLKELKTTELADKIIKMEVDYEDEE